MANHSLLLVEASPGIALVLEKQQTAAFSFVSVRTQKQALQAYDRNLHQVVLADLALADGEGMALLRELKERNPDIIFLCATANPDRKVLKMAFQEGAFDVIDTSELAQDATLLYRALQMAFEKAEFVSLKTNLERELLDANQNLLAHYSTLLENTDRLQIEKLNLEEKNRELAELSTNLDNFLSICSHDLRAPISSIQSITAFLEQRASQKLDLIEKDLLKRIRKNADYSLKLIEQLLDSHALERADTRHFEPVKITVLLNTIVHAFMFQIHQMDLNLVLIAESDDLEVNGDQIKLTQLLNNLMVNAIKYTPRKGTIRIEARPDDKAPGRALMLEIFNSGSYIPEDQRARVFEKFAQVDLTDRNKGYGLGLAIAKSICELHGGSISVKSDQQQGTTFTVRLPLAGSANPVAMPHPRGDLGRKFFHLQLDDRFINAFLRCQHQELGPLVPLHTITKSIRELLCSGENCLFVDERSIAQASHARQLHFLAEHPQGPCIVLIAHTLDPSLFERATQIADEVCSEWERDLYLSWKLDMLKKRPKDDAVLPTVLLAGADRLFLEAVGDALQSRGLAVPLFAPNGFDAIFLARKRSVAVIAADVHCPLIDGIELASRLALASPQTGVLLFADRDDHLARLGTSYFGADVVVAPPLLVENLVEKIALCLRKTAELYPIQAAAAVVGK